jgi:hypothetical protein
MFICSEWFEMGMELSDERVIVTGSITFFTLKETVGCVEEEVVWFFAILKWAICDIVIFYFLVWGNCEKLIEGCWVLATHLVSVLVLLGVERELL